MWYAVFHANTGQLLSVGTVVADPLPDGLASVAVGESRPAGDWDAQSHQFVQPTPEPPPTASLIDVGPFFDRFNGAKWSILASIDPLVQAMVRDVQARAYVDLSRADVAQGVGLLVSKSLITQAEATAVLTTPVQPAEQFALKQVYFRA